MVILFVILVFRLVVSSGLNHEAFINFDCAEFYSATYYELDICVCTIPGCVKYGILNNRKVHWGYPDVDACQAGENTSFTSVDIPLDECQDIAMFNTSGKYRAIEWNAWSSENEWEARGSDPDYFTGATYQSGDCTGTIIAGHAEITPCSHIIGGVCENDGDQYSQVYQCGDTEAWNNPPTSGAGGLDLKSSVLLTCIFLLWWWGLD